MKSTERDVVIVGGGLAGLCLARQLKLTRPATDVVVLERTRHPVPEAAFKIGESTAELAGHYLGFHLGLREYLESRQLRKTGLRFFFSNEGNRDISLRPEIGLNRFLPTRTYQLDRGRLENDLTQDVQTLGVEVREGVRVEDFELGEGDNPHFVQTSDGSRVGARWLVDASGRPGLLKRRLGLGRRLEHDVNAAWFRIADKVDITDWADDVDWKTRYPDGFRWRSTTHLCGRGYWFWVISLSSGSTSFGLVADPAWHPLETFNTFDRMLQWLDEHEPQVAQEMRKRSSLVQDFRAFRHFAAGCDRLFSVERWAIVGEAGRFLDPLYSIGSDLIATANTLTTALVHGDLDRLGSLETRVAIAQEAFDLVFQGALELYDGQYGIFGDAHAMNSKAVWDTILYYSVFALLFCHGAFANLPLLREVLPLMRRSLSLNHDVQVGLRAAAEANLRSGVPVGELAHAGNQDRVLSMFVSFTRDLVRAMTDAELRRRLDENLAFLTRFAEQTLAEADHSALTADAAVAG